ncbi:hypothetical protein ADK38_41440, partial [Streptomyces varsoviensis]
AELAVHEAQESLRAISNLHSPAHSIRQVFTLMPTGTPEEWAAIAARLRVVRDSLDGYRASLAEGLDRKLYAGPRQVSTFIGQLGEWIGEGGGWFAEFAAQGPETLRGELDEAAADATAAVAE